MKIKVKTIWQGKVALRKRKYVEKAINENLPLEIQHKGWTMTIDPRDIPQKIVGQSEQPVYDKFGKEPPDYLVYFNWKPDIRPQDSLFKDIHEEDKRWLLSTPL